MTTIQEKARAFREREAARVRAAMPPLLSDQEHEERQQAFYADCVRLLERAAASGAVVSEPEAIELMSLPPELRIRLLLDGHVILPTPGMTPDQIEEEARRMWDAAPPETRIEFDATPGPQLFRLWAIRQDGRWWNNDTVDGPQLWDQATPEERAEFAGVPRVLLFRTWRFATWHVEASAGRRAIRESLLARGIEKHMAAELASWLWFNPDLRARLLLDGQSI